MLSHVSAAAVEAHLLHMQQAALIQTATPAIANPKTAPAVTGESGGGGLQPVQNTYSQYDIYSNYIGGSIGLQSFVDGLYINVLHTTPDPKGEAFWTAHLETGSVTPYTVVSEFLIAAGGQQLRPSHPPTNIYTSYLGGDVGVTAFVDGLYYDVLQRAPGSRGRGRLGQRDRGTGPAPAGEGHLHVPRLARVQGPSQRLSRLQRLRKRPGRRGKSRPGGPPSFSSGRRRWSA